jgi:hypothetical protein
MNRSHRVMALAVLAIAIVACSQGGGSVGSVATASPSTPTPTSVASASPTSSPIGTSSPTAPAIDPATVLAPEGIGPYVIGATLSELESRALVTNIEPSFNCDDDWQHAEATGGYAAQLSFTFHLGRLIDVGTDSSDLVTPSGARVGMPLAELQSIYGTRGTLITGTSGNQAVSVRVPDTTLGIVFYLDSTNTETRAMSAGEVERLEQAAVVGEGC